MAFADSPNQQLQERLVRAKLKHREEESSKRREIMLAKQKKLEGVAKRLEEIDLERNTRKAEREKRIRTNDINDSMSVGRPESVMSFRSNSTNASRRSERDFLLEKDPKLRDLAEKLAMKKASKFEFGSIKCGQSV